MGAASAKSAASWCEGGNEGPRGGIAVVGGRGIMTGAEPNAGNASPPPPWWRGLCGGGGPELGSVGSAATGCTAADMDRSTPPNSTGRHPPEPGPLLTAGRIPPPPGSGAYGKYSSSINRRGISRGRRLGPVSPQHRVTIDDAASLSASVHRQRSYPYFDAIVHLPLFTNRFGSPLALFVRFLVSRVPRYPGYHATPHDRLLHHFSSLSLDRPKFPRNLVAADWRSIVESLSLPSTFRPLCPGRERFPDSRLSDSTISPANLPAHFPLPAPLSIYSITFCIALTNVYECVPR